MSADSLNDELDEQFDRAFGSLEKSSPQPLPIRALKKSREAISTVAGELSNDSTKVVDYQGFVRFMSTCPAPVVDAKNVEIQAFIGSGWTMSVFRGLWKTPDKVRAVAVKQLNVGLALGLSSQEEFTADLYSKVSSVILEIRMMSHELLRHHRNIVRLLGIIWHEQESAGNVQLRTTPSLLIELAASVDSKPLTLETYVEQMKYTDQNLVIKTQLLSDMASGLSALHALGVVHGDVKPENILLFEESDRLVAKISDFGFCIAGDDDLKSTRGGTQYWNAPECLVGAPSEIRKHRLENTRDYFSYGLVIWFVLFEELPFDGPSTNFNAIKLGGHMKDRIDHAFFGRYRLRQADLSPDSTVAGHWCQERYDCRSEQWIPCTENRQHVLRFLMQWVLVSSPLARRSTFDLYRRLLDDESSFKLGYRTFEQIGAWDAEWEEFGIPENRLQRDLSAGRIEARQKTLYAIFADSELEQWGRLRSYENTSSSPRIHNLQGMHVPGELQKEIFQQSLIIAKQDSKALDHIKIVAESYAVGFGTQKDLESAFQWYKAAAEAGDVEASVAILRFWTLGSTYLKLGNATYCSLLSQALLASFGTGNEANTLISHSSHSTSVEKFRDLLSQNPNISRIPLERAFQVQIQQSRVNFRGMNNISTQTNPIGWNIARDAIQYDDQDSLRAILRENPGLAMGRPDGIESLAHVAIRYGRAGLLRMLIQEFNINLSETNADGSTPLSFAIKIGSTSSMRVLLFTDKNARVAGDDAAMDNASEGKGDLTRVFYEKFVGLQQDPNETDPSKDCFLRWSFFSLASAVVNNNWGVFCTLLDIGVDPNTINPSPTAAADTFFTATMLAATTYNPLMLTAALAFGARTQTRIPFPDARTALHLACGKYQSTVASVDEDDIDMIRQWSFSRTEVSPEDFQVMQNMSIWALLQHGAAIEAQDYHGYTSLAYAIAECPDLFAAKILLELNPPANINAANFSGNTVLHEAVREGDLKRLEFCFNNGANLEQKTEMGETALAVAAKEGNIDICQQLLLAGASIKERDANGQNCLNLALQKAQFEILAIFEDSALRESTHALVRLILDEDCRGWTGLHTCIMLSPADDRFIAILERWLDVVGDIDLDHQDLLGWTLLHTAVASSEACARILLERGATIDIKDSLLGWTPLHHACNEGNADMWNLLLEFGADPYISDDLMGWTPMVVLEQAVDQARLDESEVFESIARERQARRRVRLRERATRLFTEKSLGRMVRPMIQADLEWKEEANRREAFPDEPFLAGSGAAESFREQRRYFLMDNEGSCKEWGLIVPSQPIKRSRSWQVHEG